MNKSRDLKYIYGPVSSWRLGFSLGIDLISTQVKQCTFNCVYCQLGQKNNYVLKRKIFVSTEKVIEELKLIPDNEQIDYITFSGTGEPTLAINMLEVADKIRSIRKEPIALLTNSTLLNCDDVINDIKDFDYISAKLDAADNESLHNINMPHDNVCLDDIFRGIMKLRNNYSGILAVQIMVLNENIKKLNKIVDMLKEIQPDRVELNTPLRPSNCSPVEKAQMNKVKNIFKDFNIVCVYDVAKKQSVPVSGKGTLKRRGKPY